MTDLTPPQAAALIIADDDGERESLVVALEEEGFAVTAHAPTDNLNYLEDALPDIVLLEGGTSPDSELDICRGIQKMANVPVVVMSANSDETQVVLALELGAADYITKPVRRREIVARLRAVLRRTGRQGMELSKSQSHESPRTTKPLIVGPVEIQLEARRVLVNGEPVELSRRDFDLLVILASPPGKVRTREELFDRVWPDSELADMRTLDKHIRRLRKRIEPGSDQPRYLVTVHGIGFRLDDSE
jgi:two-component system response regulator RegX3